MVISFVPLNILGQNATYLKLDGGPAFRHTSNGHLHSVEMSKIARCVFSSGERKCFNPMSCEYVPLGIAA